MITKVEKFACSDGTLVNTMEEAKAREKSVLNAQLIKVLKENNPELTKEQVLFLVEKIFKNHEALIKLCTDYQAIEKIDETK